MKKSLVIAISAVSGGGKTTLTKELASKLPKVSVLHFDDYTFHGPENLAKWSKEGADHNAWNLAPLVEDVLLLKERYDYILLDYPFAYQNHWMKDFINIAVYIDTPLDVALARRMLRDYPEGSAEEIRNDLSYYLSYGREAYLEMEHKIKPNSDLVIDGTLSREEIMQRIIEEIHKR
ncbi:hypothetical protein [Sediminibacillus halophilus]|uniref:Uridine kinase n=1 Tax=Sediminibacillus halophilus TaxID=482461 RepID=A0A1G9NI47_9BACI|nr:hypothetical protein [Sediminibacillus halophilus]SDL86074.1 Uridine kinase [Sediminibacillus halophilus]